MSDEQARLPVAVIGVGRMGRHHARLYRQLPQAKLAAVVDADRQRAEAAGEEYGCAGHASVAELLAAHPDLRAVSVATPTASHLAAARPLLERGIACLIEKPLAPSSAQARELCALADGHGAVLQVGHTERFNPALRAVVQMGIRPRFIEVRRVSPMTFRSLDVGVVMDMMIHDLDIVLMLAGEALTQVQAVGVCVLGEHEDIANARLEFASGCVADLTASRLALRVERRMRLFSETAYVSLDYQQRTGVAVRKAANQAALAEARRRVAAGADLSDLDYTKLITMEQLTFDLPAGERDPLTAELGSFLEAVRSGRRPMVDGAAGSAAVDAAERVVAAIKAHRWAGIEPGWRP